MAPPGSAVLCERWRSEWSRRRRRRPRARRASTWSTIWSTNCAAPPAQWRSRPQTRQGTATRSFAYANPPARSFGVVYPFAAPLVKGARRARGGVDLPRAVVGRESGDEITVRARSAAAERPRRPLVLLVVGALAGAGLAAAGLTAPAHGGALPAGVVALVNGEPIRTEDYARMLQALASDKRDAADRATIGNACSTASSRRSCSCSAAWRSAWRGRIGACAPTSPRRSSTASSATPTSASPATRTLAAFYAANRDFFAGPGRVRVRQVFVRVTAPTDPAALARAEDGGAPAARRRERRGGGGRARRSAAVAAARRGAAADQAARLPRPDRAARRARARRRRGERPGALRHRLPRPAGGRAPARRRCRRSTRSARRWSPSSAAAPASGRCAPISTSCAPAPRVVVAEPLP